MWKTDRHMRPSHVVAFDEAGSKVKACVLGPQEINQQTGITTVVVYYGCTSGGKTVIKWVNDAGYTGVVQVRLGTQVWCMQGRVGPSQG